jgi:hypothetical protein
MINVPGATTEYQPMPQGSSWGSTPKFATKVTKVICRLRRKQGPQLRIRSLAGFTSLVKKLLLTTNYCHVSLEGSLHIVNRHVSAHSVMAPQEGPSTATVTPMHSVGNIKGSANY